MEIAYLLQHAREIWGNEKLSLSQIIVRTGKVFGDICRWERNADKDRGSHTDDDLKKELGNIIFSTIRWCDDLGYDPKECIQKAIDCQKQFTKKGEPTKKLVDSGSLNCTTGLKVNAIAAETFERELALCKKLSKENDGGCCWGRCVDCGVLPLLVKLHKGEVIDDKEELATLRHEVLGS